MAPWELCNTIGHCKTKAKLKTKETIVQLPFPFNNQLVITSKGDKNEAQAKVEIQDSNGNIIRTLISAYAKIT